MNSIPNNGLDEYNYLNLMKEILDSGIDKDDRTGVGIRSLFGRQIRFNLSNSFPLLTTKKIHIRSAIHELLWFLNGDTNVKSLNANGVTIWDKWANDNGDLGPIYGKQWRDWQGHDQIKWVEQEIIHNPNSRRLVVSAWNVSDINKMAIPPCHAMFQFYTHGKFLSCQLYQRSADLFIGVPINIASYSLLIIMMAKVTGYIPGEFVHTFGDVHLYSNHLDQAREQLSRQPNSPPSVHIPKKSSVCDYVYDDFTLVDYNPHPVIRAPVAI